MDAHRKIAAALVVSLIVGTGVAILAADQFFKKYDLVLFWVKPKAGDAEPAQRAAAPPERPPSLVLLDANNAVVGPVFGTTEFGAVSVPIALPDNPHTPPGSVFTLRIVWTGRLLLTRETLYFAGDFCAGTPFFTHSSGRAATLEPRVGIYDNRIYVPQSSVAPVELDYQSSSERSRECQTYGGAAPHIRTKRPPGTTFVPGAEVGIFPFRGPYRYALR